jgi:hypothetical protein
VIANKNLWQHPKIASGIAFLKMPDIADLKCITLRSDLIDWPD